MKKLPSYHFLAHPFVRLPENLRIREMLLFFRSQNNENICQMYREFSGKENDIKKYKPVNNNCIYIIIKYYFLIKRRKIIKTNL